MMRALQPELQPAAQRTSVPATRSCSSAARCCLSLLRPRSSASLLRRHTSRARAAAASCISGDNSSAISSRRVFGTTDTWHSTTGAAHPIGVVLPLCITKAQDAVIPCTYLLHNPLSRQPFQHTPIPTCTTGQGLPEFQAQSLMSYCQ